jgi:AcrR family transcriptional regulator
VLRRDVSAATAVSARERLLHAAKGLFARDGYDNAGTSAIARLAGSSESQLIKHFGGKQGVLQAILDRGWQGIAAEVVPALGYAQTALAKLGILVSTTMSCLERDRELKLLFLLEGRRVRRQGEGVALSEGFVAFVGLIDGVLEEMQAAGVLRPDVRPQAVRSALMGMMEGLIRDLYLAESGGFPADYSPIDIPQMLWLTIGAMLTPTAASAAA